VDRELSRSLHALTARLDRAADRILQAEAGISYARFLALYVVRSLGGDTQRALAVRLGVSEASASRMTRVLERDGLLEAAREQAAGNRRRLSLTADGEALVARWGGVLEERLTALVAQSGVPYERYTDDTKRLIRALDARAEKDR
jgi:DNA-binding MarR family transcriptional regulator